MMQENDKKQPSAGPDKQPETKPASQENAPQSDANEHSYPGRIDQVEGRMHNGELGGGLEKEEE